MAQPPKIDTNLYSRQIGTLGMETMGKLMKLKVLVSGMRGLGVEIAKNLILAGPGTVILHDDALVEIRDLGANFYLSEANVGKQTRVQVCVEQLSQLNPYVEVIVHSGDITQELLSGCSVAVFCDCSQKDLIRHNEFCRTKKIGFIATDSFGLAGSVFVDYGDEFTIFDKDGEDSKSAIVAGITQESVGTVHTHNDRRHGFQDGDWVTFREVQGMEEVNSLSPQQIKVTGPYSFTIGDTSKFKTYTREGIVQQVKMPSSLAFKSYSSSIEKPKPEGEELPCPDLAKFGRSEHLHLAFQAVREYREKSGKMPKPRDPECQKACLELAKDLNSRAKLVDEVDADVVEKVAAFASCMLCPMASFLGGVVAQEIVKFTGKYTPLHQCLYMDMFELAPKEQPADCTPTGSRYDDQIVIFGKSFQEALGKMKLFMVGAGALGCELLKCCAMVGACCGQADGKLVVTDMDRIEVSNLNRQFLFRKENVGKGKSQTAAGSAKTMNPGFSVEAMEVRVGPESEDTFDDAFWQSLDGVINALDNIQARLYVDSRCVWYEKPLLESGTLGTKANMQVILPFWTQSYGDSQDPPEESIPLCTLKHFPNAIEHTIEWARDLFEQFFTDAPREAKSFLQDSKTYLQKLSSEGGGQAQLARLKVIKRILSERKASFDHAVNFAVLAFQEHFHDAIAQLLHTFPKDHVTNEGQPFWSGPKRAPSPIAFNAAEELHLDFVVAMANVYASTVGIQKCTDRDAIKKMAAAVSLTPFKPKEMKIKVDDKDTTREGAADDDEAVRKLAEELSSISGTAAGATSSIEAAQFEKDDDTNFHIAFITAAANLRARNYSIGEADFLKVKMTAGKIIPAMATTTAMICGLVSAELMKLVSLKSRKLEDFKNAFVSLALPLWVLSEPQPPVQTKSKDFDAIVGGPVKAKPEGFSSWDKVNVNIGDATLKAFVDHLSDDLGIEVMIMSAGNACLYNAYLPAHKKRLNDRLVKVWEDVTKQKISDKKSYLTLEVSATDVEDGVDVMIPTIKFQFR